MDILNLPHRHIELGGRFGGLETAEFRALNPHQQVPVLQDGELVIWESHAIVRYLAAKYGTTTLWNELPEKRSYSDRWIDWAATRLQPDFMALFWGYYRTPEPTRDKTAIELAIQKCAQDYRLLNSHLVGRDFLCGESLTLADIPAGATLYRYLTMGIEVARPPHVIAWYDRLCETEEYRKQIMIPYNELFGRSIF